MYINNSTSQKRVYFSPQICRVKLDNEISLILESAGSDPGEPGVTSMLVQERFNSDPFKTNLG